MLRQGMTSMCRGALEIYEEIHNSWVPGWGGERVMAHVRQLLFHDVESEIHVIFLQWDFLSNLSPRRSGNTPHYITPLSLRILAVV